MASMSIGSMGGFYTGGKKKRKPCPSKAVAEEIDREILQECLEDTEEVCENTTETRAVDEPCYTGDVCQAPPMPSDEMRTVKMKVPRGLRGLSKGSSYGDVCGDSSTARATLEDWDIHGIRLAGRIYEDKRGQYPDGEMMYTDNIKTDVSELKEGAIVRTRSNYYLLGKRHVPNDE